MPRSPRRIVLTGGATGGHLFPAIAAAEALRSSGVAEPFFLCTDRAFDRRELTAAGMPFLPLPSAGFSARAFGRAAGTLFRSVRRAAQFLDFLKPERVVGFGGHGCAAALAAARLRRIPISLFEQNAVPGKAVRLFAPWASHIYLQWPCSGRFFGGLGGRIRVVGSPLRRSLERLPREQARQSLGIESGRMVLTVVGGSQGAKGLNDGILRSLAGLHDLKDRLHFIHVAGADQFAEVRLRYVSEGFEANVFDFCRAMQVVYSATDLILCRAGATTLQEIAYFGLPSVLVPLPTAAGDHQSGNARLLAREDRAMWVPQAELRAGFLRKLVLSFLGDQGRFRTRGERLRSYFPERALDSFLSDVAEEGYTRHAC
jgi:UDP-N-acetylglucosamine--N-acetylmuramyl-(pentapeptide) pyrophosphoryl-undecaprenol N-acetylglucosamine transferase